jgi:hypothetical protein
MASASVQPLATVFSVRALIQAFTRAGSAVWLQRYHSWYPARRISGSPDSRSLNKFRYRGGTKQWIDQSRWKALAAVHLDQATNPHHRTGMKRRSVAFRLSQRQLAERDALAVDLREKTKALNAAIAAFNQAIEPLSRTVIEAQDDYNAILEKARALAEGVTEAARDEFDARSERWQGSDEGIKVRIWIEQWEVSLDDIDLEVPEPLTEIDPEEHALEIEDAPSGPME